MQPSSARHRLATILPLIAAGLLALFATGRAEAQGCVAVKMDVPVLGEHDQFKEDQRWQLSVGYRWFRSDRHFVGTDEQEDRQAEGSEVINDTHLMDFGLQYAINQRWSVQLAVPFQFIERSNPIRDEMDVVIGRTKTAATGFGDALLVARRWMMNPEKHSRGNIKFGFGLKLPTGAYNVLDTRLRYCEMGDTDCPPGVMAGEVYPSVEHVDQSIMPGDGGVGIVLDLQSYYRFAANRLAFYGSGTYIINPQGQNGVLRSRSTTTTHSVTDFYVARFGLLWTPPARPFGFSLGGRLEGVPWNDFIGSNKGFRRPGYVVSVEPGFNWGRGPHGVTFAAPIAVRRDRIWSESDRARGRGGDAAFADYSLIANYFLRF